MGNNKKAAVASIWYTVGNILTKGITFISIPIFARLLSVSDYGIVNTFSAYVSILAIIIGFAFQSCLKNAKIDFKDRLPQFASSLTVLTIINTVVLLIIAIVFRNRISEVLSLSNSWLAPLIVLESFGMAMITYYNGVLATDYKYSEYIKISIIYSVSGILISVLLINYPFSNEKWMGRILGTLLSSLLVAFIILFNLYKKTKPRINFLFWRYGLRISLPIIPHGLSQIVLSQFDRLMINKISGPSDAGLYSFSYNISTIFQVISSSIDTSWSQWFFDNYSENRTNLIKSAGSVYFILITCLVCLLMLVSPELILILGGQKYFGSIIVTYPVLAGAFFSFAYTLHSAVEYYFKKTYMIAFGTIFAAVLNVILNFLLIPKFGFQAAAYSTVICYLIYYLIHLYLAKRLLGYWIYDMKVQLYCSIIVILVMFVCVITNSNKIIRILLLAVELIYLVIFVKKRKSQLNILLRKG